MNIGFDFRMGGAINAGIGRYIFELLKRVLQHDPENRYFIFYNQNNVDEQDLIALEQYPQATLVATTIRHYSLLEQLWLPRILNHYNLDLMHFPNFNVPVMYRRPFVVTIHDMVHHKISGHKKKTLIFFYAYKYIISQAAAKSLSIITVTNAAKKEILTYLEVPKNKVHVIYEAPFLNQVAPEQVSKIKENFLVRRPYFLFVGTLERKKNIINLTRGFDIFLEKYKLDMDLILAGKVDRHYPEIKAQALDIKHQDRLVFTDFVNDDDLAALYQGAYAFVTASLHEGFGLPGVEAMQFGLPVLAANTEVFNEVYDNAAIYFDGLDPEDIAEKMFLIANDTQFYAQQQEKSFKRAQAFDWNHAARETLNIYRQALKGSSGNFEPEAEI
jgi:glycosyltransferase involved in cell wall biosynthesis